MIDTDNYIVPGDQVIAVPKSRAGDAIHGRVLHIVGRAPGRREFIVEKAGACWLTDGAIGLPEDRYIFEVQRGDAWVTVPPYLLPEEAEAKGARAVVNTRKRIQASAPLFAHLIQVEVPTADRMISRTNQSRTETLNREHSRAIRATALRVQVESLVNAEQFASLANSRGRFPRNSLYGIYFWEKQLRCVQARGEPEIYVPEPPLDRRLKVEWLKPDGEVVWMSPSGPQPARVLYIGQSSVMLRIVPESIPSGNAWARLEDLRQSTGNSA